MRKPSGYYEDDKEEDETFQEQQQKGGSSVRGCVLKLTNWLFKRAMDVDLSFTRNNNNNSN